MKLYEIALRNVLRNKRRSILSGIAIAISVMVILFYGGFINGMVGDIKKNIFGYVSGHVKIENTDYGKYASTFPLQLGIPDYKNLITQIEKVDSVKAVTPRIPFGTLIYGSPRIGKLDVKDPKKLVELLSGRKDRVSDFIANHLPERISKTLSDMKVTDSRSESFALLLDALNNVMRRYNMYNEGLFSSVKIPEETASMLLKESVTRDTLLINRLLLEAAFPEVINASPRFGKTFGSLGYGVDFEREAAFMEPEKYIVDGRIPSAGSNELLLSAGLAQNMKLTVGDKLTIFTKTRLQAANASTFKVSGIVRFPVYIFNQKSFFLPIDSASDFLQMGDTVTNIVVLGDNEKASRTLASEISGIAARAGIANVKVEPWEGSSFVSGYIQLTDFAYAFMALFFFLLGTTVIINTTMMVIYERMREIGTVSAMGMTGGEITRLFFLEAFYISTVSALVGIFFGLGIVLTLGATGLNVEVLMQGAKMEVSTMIYPNVNAGTVLFVYVYAVFVASVVSLIPSRHASKIEPVEALRSI